MQGIGDVAIDGPRLEELFRSRKDFFEVPQVGVSQGGLARILLLGCTAGLIIFSLNNNCIAISVASRTTWLHAGYLGATLRHWG